MRGGADWPWALVQTHRQVAEHRATESVVTRYGSVAITGRLAVQGDSWIFLPLERRRVRVLGCEPVPTSSVVVASWLQMPGWDGDVTRFVPTLSPTAIARLCTASIVIGRSERMEMLQRLTRCSTEVRVVSGSDSEQRSA
jgi:hypothetical protein